MAIFVSSSTAGDPENYDEAFTRFIKHVMAKYPHVKPVATESFGGRIRILEFTITDNRDMDKVRFWDR